MKRQSSKWEKIFANEATDEELISKIWAEYGRGYVYTIGMADSCWGLTKKQQNYVKQLSINKKWINFF